MDSSMISDRKHKSRRNGHRHAGIGNGRIARYLIKVIVPQLMLPPDVGPIYRYDDLINTSANMAEKQTCANQDYDLMSKEDRYRSRMLDGKMLLENLAEMNPIEAWSKLVDIFDTVFRLAGNRGLIPSRPVTLSLDYTVIPYCGDGSQAMAVEGKPDGETCHRYATIKISEKWGDLFLLALPVDDLNNGRETARDLIEFARQRVRIKHVIVDKEFFSAGYLSLFEEMGVRYLVSGVRNKKITRFIREGVTFTRMTIRSKNRKYAARVGLAFRKAEDGNTVCFATNLRPTILRSSDLFTLYSSGCNAETGFQAMKGEFMARITPGEYRVRMPMFMFSLLLYNVWAIVNADFNRILYGRQEVLRLIPARLFMIGVCQAYRDY